MLLSVCKSKIHRATVTHADLDYVGSLSIDADLMRRADITAYEMVHVYNITNGERFQTYAIEGEPGRGQIGLNGAAAHKGKVGDLIIIVTYAMMEKLEAVDHKPTFIMVDQNNSVIEETESIKTTSG